jgi:hypothetical protein
MPYNPGSLWRRSCGALPPTPPPPPPCPTHTSPPPETPRSSTPAFTTPQAASRPACAWPARRCCMTTVLPATSATSGSGSSLSPRHPGVCFRGGGRGGGGVGGGGGMIGAAASASKHCVGFGSRQGEGLGASNADFSARTHDRGERPCHHADRAPRPPCWPPRRQEAKLEAINKTAVTNGVHDLACLSGAEAAALEPQLRCSAALLSPSTGIVDSHG